ncbi:MAG: DoxX family protein [Nonlabens sp.]|uniref:DoxX family protein n=1 Tax=Nonlabens sp. TaxID=1888209 RepID=UPI0035A58C82
MSTFYFLLYFNIASFFFFGTTCLFSPHMRLEFNRYGLNSLQRFMTGVLQLAGACGLIAGIYFTYIGIAASFGLSLLMLAGLITRIKIRDGIYKSSPALIYMVLSAIIGYQFLRML